MEMVEQGSLDWRAADTVGGRVPPHTENGKKGFSGSLCIVKTQSPSPNQTSEHRQPTSIPPAKMLQESSLEV